MSGPKSPFDILLKINIYDLLSGNLNLSTRLFDFHLIFGFNACHSEIGGKTPIAITSSRNAQRCL